MRWTELFGSRSWRPRPLRARSRLRPRRLFRSTFGSRRRRPGQRCESRRPVQATSGSAAFTAGTAGRTSGFPDGGRFRPGRVWFGFPATGGTLAGAGPGSRDIGDEENRKHTGLRGRHPGDHATADGLPASSSARSGLRARGSAARARGDYRRRAGPRVRLGARSVARSPARARAMDTTALETHEARLVLRRRALEIASSQLSVFSSQFWFGTDN
jgi:hypothetical protein